jgi:translation initiation factor 2 beta subunit (eIF-2beta)/eIF-5
MQLQQLNDQLDALLLRVRQLTVRLNQAQSAQEEVKLLNQQLNKELERAYERIKELETRSDQNPGQITSERTDTSEIKKELQRYINELDKCIESLRKQS